MISRHLFALMLSLAFYDANEQAVIKEIARLLKTFPHIKVVEIGEQNGEIAIDSNNSLTIDDLESKFKNSRPYRRRRYGPQQSDGLGSRNSPYVASGIPPFRLNHFNCEFNYGGGHNYQMQDYAVNHGFSIVAPFRRSKNDMSVWPGDTKILRWHGIKKYRAPWFSSQGLPAFRYDLLSESDFAFNVGKKRRQQSDYLMLDMEHMAFNPTQLKKKNSDSKTQQIVFESKYYDAYARSFISTIKAKRSEGYQKIGIYGWSPYPRSWFPLFKTSLDRDMWERFGRSIYQNVDVVYNSVYCPYWDRRNVAFTLANIDENVKRINEMPTQIPIRPYFWPLIHGGGNSADRWWKELPHPREDQTAMIAAAFFTGIDGIVIWNWSGTSNHHKPSCDQFFGKGKSNRSVLVKQRFRMKRDDGEWEFFSRYDVLKFVGFDKLRNIFKFRKISLPSNSSAKTPVSTSVFSANLDTLGPYLFARSEPIAATVQALALIKQIELTLKTGEPVIDISSSKQFAKKLPIIRRVKNGKFHVVVTYSPMSLVNGKSEEIRLNNFAGHSGLNLTFPADQKTRIFLLSE